MAMLMGISPAVSNALGAINATMVYCPGLFEGADFSATGALLSLAVLSAPHVVSSPELVLLVAWIGCRSTCISVIIEQVIGALAFGILHMTRGAATILLVFIMCIGNTVGSTRAGTWVLNSEASFPKVCAQPFGFAVLAFSGAEHVISNTFQLQSADIDLEDSIFCYATGCFVGLVSTSDVDPGTKCGMPKEIETFLIEIKVR